VGVSSILGKKQTCLVSQILRASLTARSILRTDGKDDETTCQVRYTDRTIVREVH
jgi:hypothetical protein